MPIKKSELYASLWSSCDALRGGMDASQYKDYVLVLLFIKYVSDKYANVPFAPINVPPGSGFRDMTLLKGKSNIGDQINTKIIAPLATANNLSDMPDFNDATKLGTGKEMVERLTNLIAIFENPALDFSKNRADGDDILGDAYEYLMRHFATESGKSKGQFYTPAEVSRVMAQIIGIGSAETTSETTVYDPTCGSGSLLLKVGEAAKARVTLYGQEKDSATAGLARMNMILHNCPTSRIEQGNTLADPLFHNRSGQLKTFDYVVANPPFSDKRWSTGIKISEDVHERFNLYGAPPAKQGDFAYLLHIVRSLKSRGKGACILPHGVLFRGNSEATIRKNLIRKGLIKAVIGLPANLFYGTSIPACIIVVDKENAHANRGVFMIDASSRFKKDGPKNRLRDQDIHRIIDVFTRQTEIEKYSRMVSFDEIEKNDFNLNLPRYIDSQEPEDLQDIDAHLNGGIPTRDIDTLQPYWEICPQLRHTLFRELRPRYLSLNVDKSEIKRAIIEHPEFLAFTERAEGQFGVWWATVTDQLQALTPGFHPKELIVDLGERILEHHQSIPLIDRYDVYQSLMDYWSETMQDDCYLISANGWRAETYRVVEQSKNGNERDKGWACDLIPKELVVAKFFRAYQDVIDEQKLRLETLVSQRAEIEEDNSGEEGVFFALREDVPDGKEGKITRQSVASSLKEARMGASDAGDVEILSAWLSLTIEIDGAKRALREAEAKLDENAYAKYPTLNEHLVKSIVIEDKWMTALSAGIDAEVGRVYQKLSNKSWQLAERYQCPLPSLIAEVEALTKKTSDRLHRMGYAWPQ